MGYIQGLGEGPSPRSRHIFVPSRHIFVPSRHIFVPGGPYPNV